jgi:flagellar biosynthesis protein FlhG
MDLGMSMNRTDADNALASYSGAQGAAILAIASGKGGVGKTSVATNLAVDLAGRGLRVLLLDGDLGPANAHILLGTQPRRTLKDYIDGSAQLAEIVQEGPRGVRLISGGSGDVDLADANGSTTTKIVGAVRSLQPYCDVILLDMAAGIGKSVTNLVKIAERVLVVTTPNFTAVSDAYGLVKVLVGDGYRRPMHLIVNRAQSAEEANQVFRRIADCTERFLQFELQWLELLPEDRLVDKAIQKRQPFSLVHPDAMATRYLRKIGDAVTRMLGTTAVSSLEGTGG